MNAPSIGPLPYPLNAFHLVVCNAAQEVSFNLKTPDALAGMLFLTVMSIACQGLIDVKMPTGQIRPVSLDVVSIAESGERYSSLERCIAKSLHDHDANRMAEHKIATLQQEHLYALWEATNNALRQKLARLTRHGGSTDQAMRELEEHSNAKPVRHRLRQFIRRDMTARAFTDVLEGSGESIALLSDEGDILLRSDAMKQLGLLNAVWDGSSLALDRADGKNVLARHPRVTISFKVQPSVFRQYMSRHGENARGSGHLARYLLGWPASTQGTRYISGVEQRSEYLEVFHDRVKQLLDQYDRLVDDGKIERAIIDFSDDAKVRWVSLVNQTEGAMQPGCKYHDIRDFASKAGEITARIAAILHYFSKQEGNVSVDTLNRAIEIVGWHVSEFQRLHAPASDVSLTYGDAQLLASYLHTRVWMEGKSCIPRNDLLRLSPLRLKRRLNPALDLLIAIGYVSVIPDKSGRRYVHLAGRFFGTYNPL